ncbi:Bromodomain adjacent to zinc finger domain protein 1A [Desmophyllum pertusum]|uniref:Bromodomain adjacent to zinc finger domain protein 1A n=1 Tax=Desmophyllum pertusum TaxID=174260 RepID=A0A9W9ZEU7_9CNID|nr:Bromodomain adjacent to zinc finger domain protein 1A [Desmophyllum pertusum]
MRKRREDMAAKHTGIVDETKLKEEQKRLEKEEEEQWNINMAQCQYALRLKPIGTAEEASKKVRKMEAWKKASVETDHKQTAHENDSAIEIVEETKDENKMDSCEKDTVHKYRLPDISYEWSCYSTVEEVEALLDCLSWQGIRENALKKSLKEQLTTIIDGIARRNSSRKATKPETGEEGLFSSIKEELKDTAERLVYGNLAVLNEGLERYQETVDEASTISDLASQLEKLLPAVLPQFFQGAFTKDKKGSEEAKQCWMNAVKQATTVSRVHLLLGLLDSTIIWDLSAENARCKICRLKGIGTTLILCDDCNLGYHLQCLRPALSKVPEGHWSCPACKPNERQSSRTNAKSYKEEKWK